MIERAKRHGLANLRAVVVAPYLNPGPDDANEDRAIQEDLQGKLESVVDPANIIIRHHSDKVSWFLAINGDKSSIPVKKFLFLLAAPSTNMALLNFTSMRERQV